MSALVASPASGRPRTGGELMLGGRAGWRAAALQGVVLSGDGQSVQLATVPGAGRPLVDAAGDLGGLALPAGICVDEQERVYVLDREACLVRRYDPCTGRFETLPCLGGAGSEPRRLLEPRGIAWSRRGDLLVADTGNRRVQVFSLKGLTLRGVWAPPFRTGPGVAGAPPADWDPWDVAVDSMGCVRICDRAGGAIHVFDPSWRWLAAHDGGVPGRLVRPIRIALDCRDRLYVVQEDRATVTVLDREGRYVDSVQVTSDVGAPFCPVAVAVDDQGNLYAADPLSGGVRRLPGEGQLGDARACTGISGRAAALAYDPSGHQVVAAGASGGVSVLPLDGAFEHAGTYVSDALDGGAQACVWDRVQIDADVPAGTSLRIETLTAESRKALDEVLALPQERWSNGQVIAAQPEPAWTCLVLSTPGRFLWLRLTLSGGDRTPVVRTVRLRYPRRSSLRHLPAVFRDEPTSAQFLDRFLSIPDAIREPIVEKVAEFARFLDPRATPATVPAGSGRQDFLTWLAGWLDLALERHWPLSRRRDLLRQAHRLYALRGTPAGLRLHIRLYTGVEAHVLEHFKLRRWLFLGQTRLGDDSATFGREVVRRLQLGESSRIGDFALVEGGDPTRDPFAVYAHQFTVFVPLPGGGTENQRQTVRRIVEMASPAYAKGLVEVVEPRLRVGRQSFVGVDTVIGWYPQGAVTGQGSLGGDTVLGPSSEESTRPTMRIGRRSRVGSSSVMD
ncbi:MAG: hypothetical protein E6J41_08120 [Chloroflexi bacterium]|nr:MAG: hypothetical protein E6J41_08120 [Chloroflexota bacterium]